MKYTSAAAALQHIVLCDAYVFCVSERERERGGIKSEDVEALVDAEAKANQM